MMVKFQSFTTVIPNKNDKKITTFQSFNSPRNFVWNLSITSFDSNRNSFPPDHSPPRNISTAILDH